MDKTTTDSAVVAALMHSDDPVNLWSGLSLDLFRGRSLTVAESIAGLLDAGKPCDLPAVLADLSERGETDRDGGLTAWLANQCIDPPRKRTALALAESLRRQRCWDAIADAGRKIAENAKALQDPNNGTSADDLRAAIDEMHTHAEQISARMSQSDGLQVRCAAEDAALAPIGSLDEHYEPFAGGILRRGMVSLISGPSKSGKSFLCEALALHLAAGLSFLGLPVSRSVNVLVVDWELRKMELIERLNLLSHAHDVEVTRSLHTIAVKEYRGKHDIVAMRTELTRIAHRIKADVVIMDCLYMMRPDDVDENSNSEMGSVMKAIDRFAIDSEAAVLLVHHQGKGDKSAATAIDAGAGAGVIGRIVSCSSIAMRAHESPGCWSIHYGGRQIQSASMVVERIGHAFERRDDLSADDLRPALVRQRTKSVRCSPGEFAERYVRGKATTSQIIGEATRSGISEATARRLLREAQHDGIVHCSRGSRRGIDAEYTTEDVTPIADGVSAAEEYVREHPTVTAAELAAEFRIGRSTAYKIIKGE